MATKHALLFVVLAASLSGLMFGAFALATDRPVAVGRTKVVEATLAADTFTRADAADITGTALQTGGTWSYHNTSGGSCTPGVVSNRLKMTVVGACGGALYTDVGQADAVISLAAYGVTSSFSDSGPLLRLNSGTGTAYIASVYAGRLYFCKSTSWGTSGITLLAVYFPSTPHDGGIYKIIASGSSFTFYYDTELQGSLTDSTYTGTKAGVAFLGAPAALGFTNFSADAPGAQARTNASGRTARGT